jgi:hypothetical protein
MDGKNSPYGNLTYYVFLVLYDMAHFLFNYPPTLFQLSNPKTRAALPQTRYFFFSFKFESIRSNKVILPQRL